MSTSPIRGVRRGMYAGREGWWIAMVYRPTHMQVKAAVPFTHRYWDDGAGEWWIASEYAQAFADAFPEFQLCTAEQQKLGVLGGMLTEQKTLEQNLDSDLQSIDQNEKTAESYMKIAKTRLVLDDNQLILDSNLDMASFKQNPFLRLVAISRSRGTR